MENVMSYLSKFVVLSAVAVATLTVVSSADAGGFLADLGVATGVISRDQGRQLDQWHSDLGRPLDRINPIQQGGGFQPAQVPMVGNFCFVPGAGRFGPGPVNPVGAPCNVSGPYGLMVGQVTQ
jgi:hypothetical protein